MWNEFSKFSSLRFRLTMVIAVLLFSTSLVGCRGSEESGEKGGSVENAPKTVAPDVDW